MILIIKTNKEPLHDLEFVKPIENLLANGNRMFKTKHYEEVNSKNISNSTKIIICGTSLKDFDYIKDIKKFQWIKEYDKPLLGICAGMQIIALIHGQKLIKSEHIGMNKAIFKKEFLGLTGKHEVYELHQMCPTTQGEDFIKFTNSKIPQAIKLKNKPIYGTLFHPEVRNKELILNFAKL